MQTAFGIAPRLARARGRGGRGASAQPGAARCRARGFVGVGRGDRQLLSSHTRSQQRRALYARRHQRLRRCHCARHLGDPQTVAARSGRSCASRTLCVGCVISPGSRRFGLVPALSRCLVHCDRAVRRARVPLRVTRRRRVSLAPNERADPRRAAQRCRRNPTRAPRSATVPSTLKRKANKRRGTRMYQLSPQISPNPWQATIHSSSTLIFPRPASH